MSKKRGVLVWCLFGLATILMLVSSLTVWAKRQLLNDQAWADSSSQLLANDEVRGAIAQKLSDGLFARVDVEAQLRERLPPRSQAAAPVLAAALENNLGPAAADRLLQRPRVQALWENANKRAHAAVIRVLEGKDLGRNGNISTANGEVTLDLRPAITRLATRLGVEDKLKANADPNAGQLVIMKSDQLERRPDGGEDPQVPELAAPARRRRPLRARDLPRARAAQAAAGRDRGEPRLRRPGDRLAQALPRRGDRRRARQDGGEQASGERDLGDRDEHLARHRGHPGRLRRARSSSPRSWRARIEPRSRSGAGWHPPSGTTRSSSGWPLSPSS